MELNIHEHRLVDDSAYVQVGQVDTINYHRLNPSALRQSLDIDYPSNYKIIGLDQLYSHDLYMVSRETYDLLTWLGDIGGFMQGLEWIGIVIVCTYYSERNGSSYMVSRLF